MTHKQNMLSAYFISEPVKELVSNKANVMISVTFQITYSRVDKAYGQNVHSLLIKIGLVVATAHAELDWFGSGMGQSFIWLFRIFR